MEHPFDAYLEARRRLRDDLVKAVERFAAAGANRRMVQEESVVGLLRAFNRQNAALNLPPMSGRNLAFRLLEDWDDSAPQVEHVGIELELARQLLEDNYARKQLSIEP